MSRCDAPKQKKTKEDVCSSAFRRSAQIIEPNRLKAELQTIL
jgi:hypothetical protein